MVRASPGPRNRRRADVLWTLVVHRKPLKTRVWGPQGTLLYMCRRAAYEVPRQCHRFPGRSAALGIVLEVVDFLFGKDRADPHRHPAPVPFAFARCRLHPGAATFCAVYAGDVVGRGSFLGRQATLLIDALIRCGLRHMLMADQPLAVGLLKTRGDAHPVVRLLPIRSRALDVTHAVTERMALAH